MPLKDPILRRERGREATRRYRARHAVPKPEVPPTAHATLSEYEYRKQWQQQNADKVKAYQAKYRASHPRTEANRKCEKDYKLRAAYGITASDYDVMLAKQDGRCGICGRIASECLSKRHKHLSVDHDHATGAVRGLLCTNCNRGIGHFSDSVEMLELAIAYLGRAKCL